MKSRAALHMLLFASLLACAGCGGAVSAPAETKNAPTAPPPTILQFDAGEFRHKGLETWRATVLTHDDVDLDKLEKEVKLLRGDENEDSETDGGD